MKVIQRLSAYLSELRFAWTVSANLPSFLRLSLETVIFHLENWLRRAKVEIVPFNIDVRLGSKAIALTLRRGAGDLFTFYEVLKDEVYRVHESQCDLLQVKEIIDCGGNIGLTAIHFAIQFPNARILSIEPVPANFEILKSNCRAFPKIHPLWGCVSSSTGPSYISIDKPAWGNSMVSSEKGIEVPGCTVGDLVARLNVSQIDILKMDIEGAEKDVLEQQDFLTKTELILIELHDEMSYADFKELMKPHGFSVAHPCENPSLGVIAARRMRGVDSADIKISPSLA